MTDEGRRSQVDAEQGDEEEAAYPTMPPLNRVDPDARGGEETDSAWAGAAHAVEDDAPEERDR